MGTCYACYAKTVYVDSAEEFKQLFIKETREYRRWKPFLKTQDDGRNLIRYLHYECKLNYQNMHELVAPQYPYEGFMKWQRCPGYNDYIGKSAISTINSITGGHEYLRHLGDPGKVPNPYTTNT